MSCVVSTALHPRSRPAGRAPKPRQVQRLALLAAATWAAAHDGLGEAGGLGLPPTDIKKLVRCAGPIGHGFNLISSLDHVKWVFTLGWQHGSFCYYCSEWHAGK